MDRKEILDSYYNNYSEDDRFTKDNYHSLEYTISKHWFDKYPRPETPWGPVYCPHP